MKSFEAEVRARIPGRSGETGGQRGLAGRSCAAAGISLTTLSGWCLLSREGKLNAGERKPASDKDQEIARLKRRLRN